MGVPAAGRPPPITVSLCGKATKETGRPSSFWTQIWPANRRLCRAGSLPRLPWTPKHETAAHMEKWSPQTSGAMFQRKKSHSRQCAIHGWDRFLMPSWYIRELFASLRMVDRRGKLLAQLLPSTRLQNCCSRHYSGEPLYTHRVRGTAIPFPHRNLSFFICGVRCWNAPSGHTPRMGFGLGQCGSKICGNRRHHT